MERPFAIFLNARRYSKASYKLNSDEDIELLLPSWVNGALALELYFKVFYYLDKNKDYDRTHNFANIFTDLTLDYQDKMSLTFESLLKARDMSDVRKLEASSGLKIPRNLKCNLEAWSNVFVDLRYVYELIENGKTATMMFFPEIELTVLTIIYDIKPEWQS